VNEAGGRAINIQVMEIENPTLALLSTRFHFKKIPIFAALFLEVMQDLIRLVQAADLKADVPAFKSGDTVKVSVRIKEGNKERIQQYQGVVLQRRGVGSTETMTVRKVSQGVSVERVFPIHSPFVESIEVLRRGKVRRARLFYLRSLFGKSARIKELVAPKG
jgi:large subunit ribosomal protein L19